MRLAPFIKPAFLILLIIGVMTFPTWISGAESWELPVVESEIVPIRIDSVPISYDNPVVSEPKVIERRILSTRVISPVLFVQPLVQESVQVSEMTPAITLTERWNEPLEPLRLETMGQKTILNQVPPENKVDLKKENNFDASTDASTITRTEPVKEELFSKITFPTNEEESNRTIVLKPPLEEVLPTVQQKKTTQSEMSASKKSEQKPPPPTFSSNLTILGQSPSSIANAVDDVLKEPAPFPKGTVDRAIIDPKLFENPASDTLSGNDISAAAGINATTVTSKAEEKQESKKDKWANGSLLLVTIVSIMMLIYAVVMALDYRQRWMQSLLAQNNRFIGAFEDETGLGLSEDSELYGGGGSLQYNTGSDVLGLRRFGSEF
jgi:hypothetical protein